MAYAKKTFGVIVDEEQAAEQKRIWLETYPEFVQYFEWVNSECIDDCFSSPGETRYTYSTPFGMVVPNCSFCEVSNGAAMQAFAAEGALSGFFNVMRACYDPSQRSILADDKNGPRLRPFGFIHDEIIGDVWDGDIEARNEWLDEAARLMVESMRIVTPDVAARAEPCLMHRWNKFAEPVHDEQGRLTYWTP